MITTDMVALAVSLAAVLAVVLFIYANAPRRR